ncbi:trace amine-associated receptor 13c-like [Genypterus blacodes]|uniref:trace amine-associated receptor 13c-like n=1 Tax=Genypterus blacodes TaxID=154954 RepID=UPI003F76C08D
MTGSLSEEQYCFPDYNASCIRIQLTVGTCVILYLVSGLCILVTVVGNSVVILSVAFFKHMHKPTNVMIMSLSVVDLLVGAVVMPFSSVRSINGCWFYGDAFCLFHSSLDVFLTSLSIFHLVCIAVDRYQAICNPLHYSRTITMSVAWIMVGASWALAASFAFGLLCSKANIAGLEEYIESVKCLGSCIVMFNSLWGVLDSIICFFFPCTVLIFLYAKIFFVAKRHAKKIGDLCNLMNSYDRGKGGLIKQSEHKAAKTLSIVICAFTFCWMPFFINTVIDACACFSSPFAVFEAFLWLGYFNSTLNPIIYALFYPCFRKCFYLIVPVKMSY